MTIQEEKNGWEPMRIKEIKDEDKNEEEEKEYLPG